MEKDIVEDGVMVESRKLDKGGRKYSAIGRQVPKFTSWKLSLEINRLVRRATSDVDILDDESFRGSAEIHVCSQAASNRGRSHSMALGICSSGSKHWR